MSRLRRSGAATLALLGMVATGIVTASTASAATPPASLQGESFFSGGDIVPVVGSNNITSECNPTGVTTLSGTVSGHAAGPYPGTFTESYTAQISPQTQPTDNFLYYTEPVNIGTTTQFHGVFTITSGSTTISGTRDWAVASGLNPVGACFRLTADVRAFDGVTIIPQAETQAVEFLTNVTYTATIPTPTGLYTDSGIGNAGGEDYTYATSSSGSGSQSGYSAIFLSTGTPVQVPASVTLSPPTSANTVGAAATVTATVDDAGGYPVEAGTVLFTVAGATTTTGSCTTDASGQCTFSYQGPATAGQDTVTGCADANSSGTVDTGEPCGTATETFIPAASPHDVYYTQSDGVYRITPSDPTTPALFAGGLTDPRGVTVDHNGNVWIAQSGSPGIVEYSPTGAYLGGKLPGNSQTPTAIAVDSQGNAYVAYATLPYNGLLEVPGDGSAPHAVGSNVLYPTGVAVDSHDNVFFSDFGHYDVNEIPANGGPQVDLADVPAPYGVAVDQAGNVYTDLDHDNQIAAIPPAGGTYSTIAPVLAYALAADDGSDVFAGAITGTTPGANNRFQLVEIAPNGTQTALTGYVPSVIYGVAVGPAVGPPAITSPAADTETFGVPFSFTVTTSGYPAPKLTKSGGLPAGVSFTNNGDGTATIAGTPSGGAVGIYTLTLTAKNTAGTSSQTFTLAITKAPKIVKAPNATVTVGSSLTLPITAKGYTTPALSESGPLPAGIAFTDNGDGTGALSGTPLAGSGGSYAITIIATNGLGSTTRTLTLKVHEGPTITSPASASATVGVPFSFQATATGFPNPKITKTGTLPKGITYSAATRTFSGTAKVGTAGSYPLTLTATNSTGAFMQSFTITVS